MQIPDLNRVGGIDYKKGSFKFFVTNTSENLPSDISTNNRFLLEIINTGYDTIQRVTARGSNVSYTRYGVGNTSDTKEWSAWI